jgi:MarR family transcriptional regulator, lower aerobic nicotinate degradation pathway regulator
MKSERMEEDDSEALRAQGELLAHPGYLIRRLNQISVSIFLNEAKAYDLTHLQYASLVVVDANPGIDQSRLGRIVALDRQTVSTVVRRLVEKGLIRRESKDRRTSAMFVTGAGKALYQVVRARIGSVDKILLGPLSQADQQVLMGYLSKMVNKLNQLSRAPQSDIDGAKLVARRKAVPKKRTRGADK